MGFAITVERVALEPRETLRARCELALKAVVDNGPTGMSLATARAAETEQAIARLFDGAAHRGEIPAGLRAQLKIAEDRARASARNYENLAHAESRASLLFKEVCEETTNPVVVQGVAAALAAAQAVEKDALAQAKADEAKALAAKQRCRDAIPAEAYDHIEAAFDGIIQATLDGVVAQVGLLGPGAVAVKFQLAGHVEDKIVGTAQGSAHVWPMT